VVIGVAPQKVARTVDHQVMATRCDCQWERVELHPSLDSIVLRTDNVRDCPAHSPVCEGEDTAA
jgi:hypothetical protein